MKTLFKKPNEPFVYSHFYLRLQKWWAIRMSNLTSGFSKTKLMGLLILFVLLTGSYLIYNIYRKVSGEKLSIATSSEVSTIKTIHPKNN
jgi:hypothetical protein